MEVDPKVITISELLRRSRPITGASSINSNIPSQSKHKSHKPSHSSPTVSVPVENPPDRNPQPRVLEPLKQPTLIIGTLELPVYDNGSTAKSVSCGSKNGCFSFSDGTSRVCCDVLEMDVKIIGKQILVLSWNFIPFKCGGGFLEIIGWKLPDSFGTISRCSNRPEEHSEGLRLVHGRLESVSPVYVVPCTLQNRNSQINNDRNSNNCRNTRGFIAELMVCKCRFCSSKASVMALQDEEQGKNCHSFCVAVMVYFLGSSSSWHPVVAKLLGNVVCITGLKKKLISTEKKDSCLMYITMEKAALHMMPLSSPQGLPFRRTIIEGKGESGGYSGIVTGVYMQGMVIELDEKVWLLLTDQLLAPPHSMRVGAFVTLRNVHFVRPKFPWMRMLLLGACFRTNINVTSFSPLQTQCHIRSQRQSLLSMFTESLVFSARFWLLITASCFKRIFSRIFSEEEILGSKHRGVFMEFCKHDLYCCGNEPDYVPLKLVVPISNFFSHCETMWENWLLKMRNEPGMFGKNSSVLCKGKFYCRMIRRIMSSDDIGIVLMGTLQISPSTGRLQLIDATGCIDVVIPDFPLNCDINSVYEVRQYSVVVEGLPAEEGALGLHRSEPFSCRSIFHHVIPKKEIKSSSIYVHFYLRDATSLNNLRLPFVKASSDNLSELKDGLFHLLLITHKFPIRQNFQGDPIISKKSSLFAEAIILPWDLRLPREHRNNQVKEHIICDHRRNHQENQCNKRPKLAHTLDKALTSSLRNNIGISGCGSLNEIPCLVLVRSFTNHRPARPGLLVHANCDVMDGVIGKSSCQKVLLEFKSESFGKYQLLRVGMYYMMKYAKDDPLYNVHGCGRVCGKVLVISPTSLWSLSFSCDEAPASKLLRDHPLQIASTRNDVAPSESSNNELVFQSSPSQSPENADVNLHLAADAISILKVDIDALKDWSITPTTVSGEAANISLCGGTTITAQSQSCVTAAPDSRLPQGNLISLNGNVLDVHSYDCNSVIETDLSYEGIVDIHRLKLFQGVQSICIHVSVGHHIVRLCGTLSKHAYPIGMGAGVSATFHRVLVLGQHDLMLTPVSFIVINSVKEVNHDYNDRCSRAWLGSDILNNDTLDTVSSGLTSDWIQCKDNKPLRLRCRVVSIHTLVLEKKKCRFEKAQPNKFWATAVNNISLAGFILDDGSSLCCCWANAERAATLLRLHEETPIKAFSNSSWRLKLTRPVEAQTSAGFQFDKILNKHHKITMRNNGAMLDSSFQDLTFTANSDTLSSSDDNLLRFVSLNACCGPVFSIVGSMMEPNAVKQLEEFTETEITMHSMQNIWAREVQYINPRAEASNILQELL